MAVHATGPNASFDRRLDARLACTMGIVLGGLAFGTAFSSYLVGGGPSWTAVAVLPGSVLILAALYVAFARASRLRASDWLALGYTAAVVSGAAFVMLWETARTFHAELTVGSW